MLKVDTDAKLLVMAVLLLGAAAVPRVANAASEKPQSADACYGELSPGQKLVVERENEKARLGAQGFSPLRDFPVAEMKWQCTARR